VVFVRRHFLVLFGESELEEMATFWQRVEQQLRGTTESGASGQR
jgi:hypothetical protein